MARFGAGRISDEPTGRGLTPSLQSAFIKKERCWWELCGTFIPGSLWFSGIAARWERVQLLV